MWSYLTHNYEDKGFQTFPKGISPKVNVITQLEVELANYNAEVQYVSHYTTADSFTFKVYHSYNKAIFC